MLDQPDLFGDAADAPPAPARYPPKREHLLSPLNELLAASRAADQWPFDRVMTDLKIDRSLPRLLSYFPADEAERWRADIDAEIARLGRPEPYPSQRRAA